LGKKTVIHQALSDAVPAAFKQRDLRLPLSTWRMGRSIRQIAVAMKVPRTTVSRALHVFAAERALSSG